MSTIDVFQTCRFARPVDVVQCHFLDMQHHLAHDVHKGVKYTILEERPDRLIVRQEFKVMGLKKSDELELYATADGRIVQEFRSGDFAGGRLELTFRPEDGGTRLEARIQAPLRGFNRLMRPVIQRAVQKISGQALEEDRIDLEQHGYQPGAWARAALDGATRAA